MEQLRQIPVEKTFFTSRKITWCFFVFFISAGLMAFFAQNFNQVWLKAIYPWMFRISMVLICFSWIMPGVFILFGFPWLARAWLKGIISRISIKPWEELSKGEVFSTYFQSIIISGFIVLAIISFIINSKLAK